MRELMRMARFAPYRKGMGPRFALSLYYLGGERIGYRFSECGHPETGAGRSRRVIFEGSAYRPSPLRSIDGDYSMQGLLSFLTLRPGDTDREYFDRYTPAQMAFAMQHAEALSCEVSHRYGG